MGLGAGQGKSVFAELTAADPDAMMGSVGAYEGNRGREKRCGSAYEEEKR